MQSVVTSRLNWDKKLALDFGPSNLYIYIWVYNCCWVRHVTIISWTLLLKRGSWSKYPFILPESFNRSLPNYVTASIFLPR